MTTPGESKKTTFAMTVRIAMFGRGYWKLFFMVILITLAYSAVYYGRNYLLKPLMNDAIPNKNQEYMIQIAVAFIGLAILLFPFKYLKELLTGKLTQQVIHDLRNDVSEQIIRQPLSFFYNRNAGDLISRTTNDVTMMETALRFIYEDLFTQPIALISGIIMLFLANWRLAAFTLGIWPVLVLPLMMLGKKIRKTRQRSLEHLGGVTQSLMQMHSGIRIVKAFSMEEEDMKEFRDKNQDFLKKMLSVIKKKALSESVVTLIQELGVAIIIIAAAFWGIIDPGSLLLFMGSLPLMNNAVRELTKGYTRYQESLAGCDRIFELLSSPQQARDEPDAVEMKTLSPGVEYRNVTFAYNSEPVLRDISIKTHPGEIVAIVGRSGAGKSTMLDLLCRFHDPQTGSITAGGLDLRKIKRTSLMDHIAVVTQETFLFNSTIGENIRYGRRDATLLDVMNAARLANIHEFITGLDEGYDTAVGERGIKLSGGQRQRIAIARAILKHASILILDEATSSLDTESEQQVQDALNNLITRHGDSTQRITFVIAHRLSTVKNADMIIVLDDGSIVEHGTHAQLIKKSGLYAKLYQTQFAE